MLKKIILIMLFILICYSNVFANDTYISLSYSNGNDSMFIKQQKEEQTIYGIEYGQKFNNYKRLWGSIEGAYSTHKYTRVRDSFRIKFWGIYKFNIFSKVDLYSALGIGLSTYKDNDLVKRCPSSSIGLRIGLEYHITEKTSIITEYESEHNSGIWVDDNGRNLEFVKMGFRYYF